MTRFILPVVLGHALLTSSALSQTIDTARVRAAYDSVTARRNAYEKSHGRFAQVNGIKMHYLEWGAPNGVPLVWAHGSASSAYEIRAVAPRLVQAGYRVLAVDYRGHGLTHVTSYDFTIHHIADDLIGLLDHLKIPAAVFGGASKGGFVAAAVYDHYPNRVLGLLMSDGGTWSNQWVFDRQTPDEIRRFITDPVPQITGASEFDVFLRVVGALDPTWESRMDWLFEMLMRIGRDDKGEWAFLPGFDRLMGSGQIILSGVTRPTTLPPLQWSQHAMMPRAVFRRLHVPMMILDPQEARDHLPVTDQNERLAKDHPDLIVHRIYPESGHNIFMSRPDWFVRDAVELLGRVRSRGTR
ncbi:MAG TPA: alpha/beta hydrolase [Gemmatimonadaceae bacterium]|nr:alpha/beta hydrolase [Gemmatimonadaceae bacterium]